MEFSGVFFPARRREENMLADELSKLRPPYVMIKKQKSLDHIDSIYV